VRFFSTFGAGEGRRVDPKHHPKPTHNLTTTQSTPDHPPPSPPLNSEHAPSIIFMDEVDSIGSARMDNSGGGGDSEVQRTMLELLNQLDGFEASNKIKVLMATNRIDILDAALLRPGRIDRKVRGEDGGGFVMCVEVSI
jgi:hypothetical protein